MAEYVAKLSFTCLVADTLNTMMSLPKLIALILLSPVVFKQTKEFVSQSASTP